jgi:hypothetical protein
VSAPAVFLRPKPELRRRLDAAAKSRGVTVQQLIYGILDDTLPEAAVTIKAFRDIPLPGFPLPGPK